MRSFTDTPFLCVYSQWYICRKKLEEAKELQKFRKKPAGVRYILYRLCTSRITILIIYLQYSAVGLAFGKKFSEDEKLAVRTYFICRNTIDKFGWSIRFDEMALI